MKRLAVPVILGLCLGLVILGVCLYRPKPPAPPVATHVEPVVPDLPSPGLAQPQKTVLAVSLAGFDAVMESVNALTKAAGVPEMAMLPIMMLGGPAGPPGLDGSKPLGLIVQTDGRQFPKTVFAPITDSEKFLEFIKGYVQDIPEPDSDGVYAVEADSQTVFIQQKDGWAFAVLERADLANTPDDPAALLGGMEKEFTLGLRVQVANMPPRDATDITDADVYKQLVEQIQLRQSGQRKEGETDEQYDLRQEMTKQTLDKSQKLAEEINAKLAKEVDSLTIGLGIDATDGAINLDVALTAVEGTSIAKHLAEAAGLKSAFNGFFNPDAAMAFRVTSKIPQSSVIRDLLQMMQIKDLAKTRAKQAIESAGLGEAITQQALEIGKQLLAAAEETIDAGEIDAGLSLMADDDGLVLIAGAHVADGAKLEEIFEKAVEQLKEEEPDLDQLLEMNVAQHKGVNFHTLSVPAALVFEAGVPPAYADIDVKITVGFGDSAVYLAHGPDPVALLKAAIDQSAAAADDATEPAQLSLSAIAIGSLLEIIGATGKTDIPPALIAALKKAGDPDHLLVSAEAIPSGMKLRLAIEGGVLNVIGAAVKGEGTEEQPVF